MCTVPIGTWCLMCAHRSGLRSVVRCRMPLNCCNPQTPQPCRFRSPSAPDAALTLIILSSLTQASRH